MDFDSWTVRSVDTLRVRRLVVGWLLGGISVALAMAVLVLTSKGSAAMEEEEEAPIEVALAKEAEPPPPPPPPPPPTDKPKAPPRPRLASPVAVPDDKPAEKEPTPQQAVVEEEEEKPAEPAIASAAPPPPPAPVVRAKPQVKKPIRLTEDMPKPVQTVMKTPDYPAAAKAAGVEGVVIVKYIIAEDGSVRDAKVLKGPPELADACLAAVRTWRFQPIVVDGAAAAVVRIARFPFHIR
jgi:periplasmic protein TonB